MSEPRLASTVMLARPAETDGGFELFMVRRPVRSEFAADVYVFPGGAVRDDDLDPLADRVCAPFGPVDALQRLAERGGVAPRDARAALGLWVAALRELYEEAGVLLVEPAPSPAARARLAGARDAVREGARSLAAVLEQERLRLACERLLYFSHWITPPSYPRRFDTRFFVALLPAGQEARHCEGETVESAWIAPREALRRATRGEFPLVFVTQRHLERIATCASLDALLRLARTKPVRSVHAELERESGEPRLPDGLEGRW